jgi:hypothetical protein
MSNGLIAELREEAKRDGSLGKYIDTAHHLFWRHQMTMPYEPPPPRAEVTVEGYVDEGWIKVQMLDFVDQHLGCGDQFSFLASEYLLNLSIRDGYITRKSPGKWITLPSRAALALSAPYAEESDDE